uniref:ANK_REP_REGION domain-containing protein n=1 Tax=Macrostomum lignano TaxID=282301 RepID=A0A1I8JJ95_9PLAT
HSQEEEAEADAEALQTCKICVCLSLHHRHPQVLVLELAQKVASDEAWMKFQQLHCCHVDAHWDTVWFDRFTTHLEHVNRVDPSEQQSKWNEYNPERNYGAQNGSGVSQFSLPVVKELTEVYQIRHYAHSDPQTAEQSAGEERSVGKAAVAFNAAQLRRQRLPEFKAGVPPATGKLGQAKPWAYDMRTVESTELFCHRTFLRVAGGKNLHQIKDTSLQGARLADTGGRTANMDTLSSTLYIPYHRVLLGRLRVNESGKAKFRGPLVSSIRHCRTVVLVFKQFNSTKQSTVSSSERIICNGKVQGWRLAHPIQNLCNSVGCVVADVIEGKHACVILAEIRKRIRSEVVRFSVLLQLSAARGDEAGAGTALQQRELEAGIKRRGCWRVVESLYHQPLPEEIAHDRKSPWSKVENFEPLSVSIRCWSSKSLKQPSSSSRKPSAGGKYSAMERFMDASVPMFLYTTIQSLKQPAMVSPISESFRLTHAYTVCIRGGHHPVKGIAIKILQQHQVIGQRSVLCVSQIVTSAGHGQRCEANDPTKGQLEKQKRLKNMRNSCKEVKFKAYLGKAVRQEWSSGGLSSDALAWHRQPGFFGEPGGGAITRRLRFADSPWLAGRNKAPGRCQFRAEQTSPASCRETPVVPAIMCFVGLTFGRATKQVNAKLVDLGRIGCQLADRGNDGALLGLNRRDIRATSSSRRCPSLATLTDVRVINLATMGSGKSSTSSAEPVFVPNRVLLGGNCLATSIGLSASLTRDCRWNVSTYDSAMPRLVRPKTRCGTGNLTVIELLTGSGMSPGPCSREAVPNDQELTLPGLRTVTCARCWAAEQLKLARQTAPNQQRMKPEQPASDRQENSKMYTSKASCGSPGRQNTPDTPTAVTVTVTRKFTCSHSSGPATLFQAIRSPISATTQPFAGGSACQLLRCSPSGVPSDASNLPLLLLNSPSMWTNLCAETALRDAAKQILFYCKVIPARCVLKANEPHLFNRGLIRLRMICSSISVVILASLPVPFQAAAELHSRCAARLLAMVWGCEPPPRNCSWVSLGCQFSVKFKFGEGEPAHNLIDSVAPSRIVTNETVKDALAGAPIRDQPVSKWGLASRTCTAAPTSWVAMSVLEIRRNSDLNFALARKKGLTRCDWCPGGATTENSHTCLKRVKLHCKPGDAGSEVCKRTTDRKSATFATIPAGSSVRYRLERPAKLASIVFLRNNHCCSTDVEDLKITLSDQSWCTLDTERIKKWSTRKYARMNHCTSRGNIEYFDVATWKRNGSMTLREIQFGSLELTELKTKLPNYMKFRACVDVPHRFLIHLNSADSNFEKLEAKQSSEDELIAMWFVNGLASVDHKHSNSLTGAVATTEASITYAGRLGTPSQPAPDTRPPRNTSKAKCQYCGGSHLQGAYPAQGPLEVAVVSGRNTLQVSNVTTSEEDTSVLLLIKTLTPCISSFRSSLPPSDWKHRPDKARFAKLPSTARPELLPAFVSPYSCHLSSSLRTHFTGNSRSPRTSGSGSRRWRVTCLAKKTPLNSCRRRSCHVVFEIDNRLQFYHHPLTLPFRCIIQYLPSSLTANLKLMSLRMASGVMLERIPGEKAAMLLLSGTSKYTWGAMLAAVYESVSTLLALGRHGQHCESWELLPANADVRKVIGIECDGGCSVGRQVGEVKVRVSVVFVLHAAAGELHPLLLKPPVETDKLTSQRCRDHRSLNADSPSDWFQADPEAELIATGAQLLAIKVHRLEVGQVVGPQLPIPRRIIVHCNGASLANAKTETSLNADQPFLRENRVLQQLCRMHASMMQPVVQQLKRRAGAWIGLSDSKQLRLVAKVARVFHEGCIAQSLTKSLGHLTREHLLLPACGRHQSSLLGAPHAMELRWLMEFPQRCSHGASVKPVPACPVPRHANVQLEVSPGGAAGSADEGSDLRAKADCDSPSGEQAQYRCILHHQQAAPPPAQWNDWHMAWAEAQRAFTGESDFCKGHDETEVLGAGPVDNYAVEVVNGPEADGQRARFSLCDKRACQPEHLRQEYQQLLILRPHGVVKAFVAGKVQRQGVHISGEVAAAVNAFPSMMLSFTAELPATSWRKWIGTAAGLNGAASAKAARYGQLSNTGTLKKNCIATAHGGAAVRVQRRSGILGQVEAVADGPRFERQVRQARLPAGLLASTFLLASPSCLPIYKPGLTPPTWILFHFADERQLLGAVNVNHQGQVGVQGGAVRGRPAHKVPGSGSLPSLHSHWLVEFLRRPTRNGPMSLSLNLQSSEAEMSVQCTGKALLGKRAGIPRKQDEEVSLQHSLGVQQAGGDATPALLSADLAGNCPGCRGVLDVPADAGRADPAWRASCGAV